MASGARSALRRCRAAAAWHPRSRQRASSVEARGGVADGQRVPVRRPVAAPPRACRRRPRPRTRAGPSASRRAPRRTPRCPLRLSTGLPLRLLGPHVGRRAEDQPDCGHRAARDASASSDASALAAPRRLQRLRQPEVEHLHRAVGAHLDVGRLEIAMDDALLVRRFERLGDLPRDRQRLVERNRPARDAVGERRPFDQLQDERRATPVGCLRSRRSRAMFG